MGQVLIVPYIHGSVIGLGQLYQIVFIFFLRVRHFFIIHDYLIYGFRLVWKALWHISLLCERNLILHIFNGVYRFSYKLVSLLKLFCLFDMYT